MRNDRKSGAFSGKIIKINSGAIMLITLLFLLLLTILGTSSLYLAYTEMILSRGIEADARAFYIAESKLVQTLYWFTNPDKYPGSPGNFFRKQMINNTSFFDENQQSQYKGTITNPDIVISGADSELIIYRPVTPGALCIVRSKGISGKIIRVVTAELFEDLSGVEILSGSWRTN